MTGKWLGLVLAFFIYPCLLFFALLGTQLIQFIVSRGRIVEDSIDSDDGLNGGNDKRPFKKVSRSIIWTLQSALSALILASIILVAWEAASAVHDGTDKSNFPWTAYQVSLKAASPF